MNPALGIPTGANLASQRDYLRFMRKVKIDPSSIVMGGRLGLLKSGVKGGGRTFLAHRWMYEHEAGRPIAVGMTIDHRCRNKRCVNFAHLEEVTLAENIQRANAARRRAA